MIANPNDGNSPRVEVATPMIDVSAGGLITATTEQAKGYVLGGTKSATQQLTTQGAATITPGTTAQTAVASGRYTTGDVVVAGDVNLVPENIAEGVSIFGVDGTHSGGGGDVATRDITIQNVDAAHATCYFVRLNNDGVIEGAFIGLLSGDSLTAAMLQTTFLTVTVIAGTANSLDISPQAVLHSSYLTNDEKAILIYTVY